MLPVSALMVLEDRMVEELLIAEVKLDACFSSLTLWSHWTSIYDATTVDSLENET